MQIVLVSGLSGSGKSIAIAVLEDIGFYCVDNLPLAMLQPLVDYLKREGHTRIAIAIDARSSASFSQLPRVDEALREQRDWMHNPTVLSGDLAGDDAAVGGVVTTVDDIVGRNSRRVVEGSNDASSVLDGFTITAGDGHDCAGMAAGPMQLANLAFSGSGSAICAGGLCLGGGASLSNVLFTGNRAERGGGLVVEHSSPTLSNVTFEDNVATHEGGGAYIYGMGTVRIVEAILARNSAEQRGGGLAIDTLSQVILDRVTYTENDASRGGGISVVDSKLTLRNVAISDNTAQEDGGGLHVSGGSIDAANLLVVGNTAQRDGGGIANLDSQVGMVNATIAYNKAPTGKGGGIANLGAKSTPLKNTIVWGNEAATDAQIHDATPPGSGGEYECLVQDRYRNCRKGAADRPPFRREGRQAALADPKFSLQPAN